MSDEKNTIRNVSKYQELRDFVFCSPELKFGGSFVSAKNIPFKNFASRASRLFGSYKVVLIGFL